MMWRARLCTAVVFVSLTISVSPATASTQYKRCGSQHHMGAGWYHVRAHRVSCEHARQVARKYWDNSGPRHVTVAGVTYRCRDEQTGEETSRVRCRAPGSRRVRFEVGS